MYGWENKKEEMSKIGVFDSGFGGLTVLRGIREKLPEYEYIYLGDTARTPYGTRSQELIYDFTRQAVEFLIKNDCDLIILACNTASSEALRKIQQVYLAENYPEKRVLGVVIPTCEEVAGESYKEVGIMATGSTVNSGSYIQEIKKLDQRVKVIQQACPLLVPIIESGEIDGKVIDLVIKDYLKPLLGVDAIILGCTHYEIILGKIESFASGSKVIPQSKIVADKLADYLLRHPEIEQKLTKKKQVQYYTTDLTDYFRIFGESILGEEIPINKIELN